MVSLADVMNCSRISLLVVDVNLKIRFFTACANTVLPIGSSDLGRPLSDLAPHSADQSLIADCQAVVANQSVPARLFEVDGLLYLRELRPYRSGGVKWLVITFSDISSIRASAQPEQAAHSQCLLVVVPRTNGRTSQSGDPQRPLDDTPVDLGGTPTEGQAVPDEAPRPAGRSAGPLAKLSTREVQILNKILDGRSNKNIAADLNISRRTVENHRASIMKKTRSRSVPELVRQVMMARGFRETSPSPAPDGGGVDSDQSAGLSEPQSGVPADSRTLN